MPGEQPRIANLVKLNTNESPFGPSPLALEAMRDTATDTLRLYPDPEGTVDGAGAEDFWTGFELLVRGWVEAGCRAF